MDLLFCKLNAACLVVDLVILKAKRNVFLIGGISKILTLKNRHYIFNTLKLYFILDQTIFFSLV